MIIIDIEKPSNNPDFDKMVENLLMYYLKNFWKTFCSICMFVWFSCTIVYFFSLKEGDIYYNFNILALPLMFVLFSLLDVVVNKYKFILKYVFIVYMIGIGIVVWHENTIAKEYKIFEIWYMINTAYFMISLVQALEHKKVIFAFFFVQIYYLILMHYTYGVLNPQFYMGYTAYFIWFPIITIGASKLIRDLLMLVQENKELAETIQQILKKFPEAVIVQSSDEHAKQSQLQFSNYIARKYFTCMCAESNQPHLSHNLMVSTEKIEHFDDLGEAMNSSFSEFPWETLTEFIKCHERALEISNNSQLTHIKTSHKLSEKEESVKYYQVKSLKVKWNDIEDSYLHMFIDTTTIKEYEKEKTANKCLHAMFSSVSHEYRTPINAITNVLDLINMNVTKLK